jgi:Fic family protein
LLFELDEASGVPLDDVAEVSNYVSALVHGVARLREGFALSSFLICDIHGVLLSSGRGSGKDPSEFRRSQNWIGGTRPGNAFFVPLPHTTMADCMAELERFFHAEDDRLPVLCRVALAHVQFETIHPFLDGNGRVGRLLITFQLCHAGLLQEPLLYLSLYFKQNRTTYYDLLDRVRRVCDWEAWSMAMRVFPSPPEAIRRDRLPGVRHDPVLRRCGGRQQGPQRCVIAYDSAGEFARFNPPPVDNSGDGY